MTEDLPCEIEGHSMDLPKKIDLAVFARGTVALSTRCCADLAEQAAFCLEYKGHTSGVPLRAGEKTVEMTWEPLDPRAGNSHNDLQVATENGAVALAIEMVRGGTNLEVVRRSRKGPGFDWHLGPKSDGPAFAQTHCLEVSGILDSTDYLLDYRLKQKVRQAGKGVPGFAVVIGFAAPSAKWSELT